MALTGLRCRRETLINEPLVGEHCCGLECASILGAATSRSRRLNGPAREPLDGHHRALRTLGNRRGDILQRLLRHRTHYDHHKAWPTARQQRLDALHPWGT
jgi:hypothetical protein